MRCNGMLDLGERRYEKQFEDTTGRQTTTQRVSVAIHIAIRLRIWKHRKNNSQTEISNPFHKDNVLSSLEKESIADFTSNVVGVLALTSFSLLSIKINSF